MKCKQRLYLTAARDVLVAEGDPAAAILYAVPGDEIPDSAVEMFGLVDGGLKGSKAGAGSKEKTPGEDKERKDGADKSGKPQDPPTPDNLEDLKGVGHKTAQALVKAGLTSFAAVAAVDPGNPPAIDGLSPTFKWGDVVASAKEKAPPAETEQSAEEGAQAQ